jgi:hypothetical protein
MHTPADAVATYIRAKDENRPHRLSGAFVHDAALEMVVKTAAISFPARSVGLDAIADVLVRKFGQTYENVYTVCLGSPPAGFEAAFECDWLVGMSEKAGGAVRVGCGRYDWRFRSTSPALAERLTITIERMEMLPASALATVMEWLVGLPYPWCPRAAARDGMPALPPLAGIQAFLDDRSPRGRAPRC